MGTIEKFIDQAESNGETVLVFCSNGQNRSLSIVVLYLMRRFRWSFYKTLQFLDSKRPNLEIKKNYFKYLKDVAETYELNVTCSKSWNKLCSLKHVYDEEVLITNTYLNSFKETEEPPFEKRTGRTREKILVWADQLQQKRQKSISKKPETEKNPPDSDRFEKTVLKRPKLPIDRKKLENFLRKGKSEILDEKPIELPASVPNLAVENLFSRGLKDMKEKLKAKDPSGQVESNGSSGVSKISTTIQEDSLNEKQKKSEERDLRTPRVRESEHLKQDKTELSSKRPSSAPTKDDQKERLIQMHLFMDNRKKGPLFSNFISNKPKNLWGRGLKPKDELERFGLSKNKLR